MSDRRFEELVSAHGRRVLNVALRILGDADLAKDAYQEVFLAIWRRWGRYDDQLDWGAYLYRVTVRKALEIARSRRPSAPLPIGGCERQSTEPDPAMALRFDELQQKLTESLTQLPKHQADVFVLSRIEGLDHAAIAEILDCTANNVRVSLHRAVRRLARDLRTYRSESASGEA
ncbi:MAG: sigma-70 family RNA polymerase sigma factor [Sedimentisphaerales bacterium]|nr:sigma-70 family RNA polymerase sigma factor [Sedimentisphaerales bacterium]